MRMRGGSVLTAWVNLAIWLTLAASGPATHGDDSETVASLKKRNQQLEAELKTANTKVARLAKEVERLNRKLSAIRRELEEDPIPTEVDVVCYNDLRLLLLQIREKRKEKSPDFAEIRERASEISKKYMSDLKNEAAANKPHKQLLLWAIRDDLPRLTKGDLAIKSSHETSISAKLDEVEKLLSKLDEE